MRGFLSELFLYFQIDFAPELEEIESAFVRMSPSTLDEVPRAVPCFFGITIATFSDPPV